MPASAKLAGSNGAIPKTSVRIMRAPATESDRARDDAGQHRRQPLAKHQPQDISALGAERHADADLARALDDEVSHDSVNPDGGQRQSQQREARDQDHVETRP